MNALDGIRVVDLTHAISGPTCTNALVQMGADVVKVEPPHVGDGFRHYTEHAGEPLLSVPFASINAGKRSIALDLKTEGARNAFWKLIEQADFLVENYRPGVLSRLGFPIEDLRRRNPRLIVISITGFGQSGPLAQWGAYDHIAQAISGIAALGAVEGEPRKIGLPIIDSFTGYIAVIAALAALRRRDASGEGEHVDVAMLDAALKLANQTVSVHSYTGRTPGGTGNKGFRMVPTSEFYPTGEGWIALGANNQAQVEAMLRVLGEEAMLADPRMADHAARVANYDFVRGWLEETLSRWSAEDLETRLTAAKVPAAMIREVGQIVEHPHMAQRGSIQAVDLPGHDRPLATMGPGFPVDTAERHRVPVLGIDGEAILSELGYDSRQIEDLRNEGAFA
ncbi:CaiB/BaiF CoA transferase family protein [Novosphingobium sp. ZW T3_23]|uniref:CaiB/BaiF CoA transferase family protein n=1 Tax=Novosphingobium sp. ZW T3_23 TaxID=3378084 RepID=UPI003853054D